MRQKHTKAKGRIEAIRRRKSNGKPIDQYVHFYNLEHINLKNSLTPYEIGSKATQYCVILR